jgi:uncharacterized protein
MEIGVLRRDGRTDPFFDGTAAERLVIKRCEACDRWFAPDAASCPGCGTEELTWAEATGRGSLVTWTISHGRPAPDGTAPGPAVLALVELEEGPWLYARLDGVQEPAEGLPLKAHFVHPAEGESYLIFRP